MDNLHYFMRTSGFVTPDECIFSNRETFLSAFASVVSQSFSLTDANVHWQCHSLLAVGWRCCAGSKFAVCLNYIC